MRNNDYLLIDLIIRHNKIFFYFNDPLLKMNIKDEFLDNERKI